VSVSGFVSCPRNPLIRERASREVDQPVRRDPRPDFMAAQLQGNLADEISDDVSRCA